MGTTAKTQWAAALGALMTIATVLLQYYAPDFAKNVWNGVMQGAVQTILTTAAVYLIPNAGGGDAP